ARPLRRGPVLPSVHHRAPRTDHQHTPATGNGDRQAMTPLRTLIVDDEQLARRGLALRLKDFPEVRVVGECGDGQQALLAIAEHEPELVFLDIQMPGMNGFDVIAQLQGDTLPMIVFVTAY